MHKKTSITIGLAIATILTAYISGLTLSNQAFAQGAIGKRYEGAIVAEVGNELAGHEAQAGKLLKCEAPADMQHIC